jgi:transmembrane sensor
MVSDLGRTARNADAEAAAWLARLQGPARDAATDRSLKAWLREDAAHQDAFERATEIWDMIPGAAAGLAAPQPARDRSRHRTLAAALATLLLLLIGGAVGIALRAPVHETPVGGQQVVLLDDGTRVSLNTDSRIAVLFADGERRVRLERGEALFEVAHDAARPFIVEAGDQRVRALGTVFLVRRDGEARTEVTLLEGRVDVSGAQERRIAILSPGQRVTVAATAGARLDRPAIDTVVAWRRGEVVFEDTALADAVAELNRYSRTHLVLADLALAPLRISGVFSTGNPGEVAEAVAMLHHLDVRREGDEIRLTRR